MHLHLRGEIGRRSFLKSLGVGLLFSQTAYANGNSKEVYLTIDDGPSPNMRKILDTIDEYPGNYLTFFLLGENLHDETLYRMAREAIVKGHVVGNHTYSHRLASKTSYERFIGEIKATTNMIEDLYSHTGVGNPKLFRFPYGDKGGKKNAKAIRKFLDENGYTDYFWDGDTLDWKYYSGNRSLEKVLDEVRNAKQGEVVLTHDFYRKGKVSTPVEAIKVLVDEGYCLRTLEGKRKFETEVEDPLPELKITIERRGKVTIEGPEPAI